MVAEKGSAFLIKISDGGIPPIFTTVAGMRTNRLTFNANPVEITNKGSQGWRELLPGAGVKGVGLSGSGVFTDSTAERSIQTMVMDASQQEFQIVFESGDYFTGQFQVTSLEYGGDFNGERTYTIQLQSSGAVSFTDV